jgi:hypothetical protein
MDASDRIKTLPSILQGGGRPHMAAGIIAAVQPLTVRAAAQELRQCYVEGQPCGTPQQLYDRIQHCLQEPYLCRDVRITKAGNDLDAASARPVPGVPSPDRVTTALPARRVIHSRIVGPSLPVTEATSPEAAAGNRATEQPGGPIDAVTKAARELPLDPAVKTMNDTMPYDAAAVEHRLGLHRPRVAGIDMRQRTLTPAEIVDALEPAKDSHR